jgi:hypothetical protein
MPTAAVPSSLRRRRPRRRLRPSRR